MELGFYAGARVRATCAQEVFKAVDSNEVAGGLTGGEVLEVVGELAVVDGYGMVPIKAPAGAVQAEWVERPDPMGLLGKLQELLQKLGSPVTPGGGGCSEEAACVDGVSALSPYEAKDELRDEVARCARLRRNVDVLRRVSHGPGVSLLQSLEGWRDAFGAVLIAEMAVKADNVYLDTFVTTKYGVVSRRANRASLLQWVAEKNAGLTALRADEPVEEGEERTLWLQAIKAEEGQCEKAIQMEADLSRSDMRSQLVRQELSDAWATCDAAVEHFKALSATPVQLEGALAAKEMFATSCARVEALRAQAAKAGALLAEPIVQERIQRNMAEAFLRREAKRARTAGPCPSTQTA